ncbi:MAG: DUF1566 domain-containing protein [Ilumatobacteraceae bacterium]|nr:DUF1566 domain-containing protein [Ilumatobacteraceae bacterium]
MTTKAELGASKKNFEAVKASLRDVNLEAPAVAAPFLYTSLGALPGVEANPFGLPSLDELMVVCNYANGSPMRTDGCTPGTLRSDFQADWYWSSTIAGADTGQPVYAVNFKTGQVQKLARKVYAYIRPIRTFYSTLDTTVVTTVPVVTMPPTTVAPTTVPPTTVATTVPPTTTATTLPPTTLAVTTLPPTTVVRTTLPPTTAVRTTVAPSTTAATAVTKACTPSSPCKPGDVMPDGSTVFYYSPTPFNCDWQLSATGRKCNMLAYAHFNWYDKAIVNFGGPGPCRPPSEFMSDPTCTWNTGESKPDLTFATKPEIGMGAYNRLQTTKYFTDRGEISIADFVKSYNGEDGTTTGFELPTRGELYLLCNWLMNTPLSTTKCGFNSNRKENANRFAHYAYWSSTFQFTPGYSGTCPFTLSPWFILDYPQCRGARQRVRPFRAFRGFVDPSYVPPTTIP